MKTKPSHFGPAAGLETFRAHCLRWIPVAGLLLITFFGSLAQEVISVGQKQVNYGWLPAPPSEGVIYWKFYLSPSNRISTNVFITFTNGWDATGTYLQKTNGWYVGWVTAVNTYTWSTNRFATNAIIHTNELEGGKSSDIWLLWNGAPSAPTWQGVSFPPLPPGVSTN